jgi:uncharacterized ferritin-like protein (DUF455 family)
MKPFLPVGELARDDRFHTVTMHERASDPRGSARQAGTEPIRRSSNRLTPSRKDATDAARALMHGILVGEVQALEGAGRTCFDFETADTRTGSTGADAVPFDLKLDMARQCWDEARHVEISAHLSTWMGTGIGDYAENTVLFEAACSRDPVLRLAGVNRALEGLAIDVFTTMKEFGDIAGDPVLEFCEDWMLADEVTHVKMGSDWLRRLTATDPDRRKAALEFQQVVDKLFSNAGARSDSDESVIGLARRFRELAGFSQDEIDEIAAVSAVALDEAKEHRRQERAEAVAALGDAARADAARTGATPADTALATERAAR